MDTSLTLPSLPSAVANANTPAPEQASTRKVIRAAPLDQGPSFLAKTPFVAQVVSARLSGTAFPENPGEIAPEDRTLRPYDVPMLPYDPPEQGIMPSSVPEPPASDRANISI